jgi:hypothetical protein
VKPKVVKTEVKLEAKVKPEAKVKLEDDKAGIAPAKKAQKKAPKDKEFPCGHGFNRPTPQECHQVWK